VSYKIKPGSIDQRRIYTRGEPFMKYITVIFICFLYIASCQTDKTDPLIFSVMGDVPRSAAEDTLLQRQIQAHNKYSQAEFMLHVGDIKSGGAPCDEEVYQRVSGFLKQIKVPTFIVPGDNEWNDCPDPSVAWKLWTEYFIDFDKNWSYGPDIHRQQNANENISWITKDVLMVGINLVGGRIHDQTEWDAMIENANEWIKSQLKWAKQNVQAAVIFAQANPKSKHQKFMQSFLAEIEKFKKPVLFVHGDGHRWIYEKSWKLPNLTRVQVDQGRIALPLEVIVNFVTDSTFQFNRSPFPFPYEMK
jgi:hypothetical protein